MRPILVILTAKLFGQVNDRVLASAASVEMLHNASLIHDDVVDEAKMRRSEPTINSVWDNHIAVLVGDFFVSSALQQALATNDLRIIDSIAHLGRLLSLGEIDQIYNARYHQLSEEAYYEVIRRKTASLFVACVRMGAFSVGVDDDRMERMSRFADLLGLCFQIRDDIFDYYDDDKVGKPTGNDLREGKITLPLLYALSQNDNPQCETMLQLSRQESLTSQEIATLIDYAKSAGGIEYARQAMDKFHREALTLLDSFGNTEETNAFRSIFDYIIKRDK